MANVAEFYLENGNHIKVYHNADVMDMIENYEECKKKNFYFGLYNWDEDIEELWYNGRKLDANNFSFHPDKVDLHKFEG